MSQIRWTPKARRDFREIIERLGDANPRAAERIAQRIETRLALLASMPRMGRIGRAEGTRELVISRTPFIVIYELGLTDQIVILRVLHSAQRWPSR